jgi:hypothetical protein
MYDEGGRVNMRERCALFKDDDSKNPQINERELSIIPTFNLLVESIKNLDETLRMLSIFIPRPLERASERRENQSISKHMYDTFSVG